MRKTISLKTVISMTKNPQNFEQFYECAINLSPSILASEINNFLADLKTELIIAVWKANAAKTTISSIKILVDGRPINPIVFLGSKFLDIEVDDLKKVDSDIISSVNQFIRKIGPEIAFAIIKCDQFRYQ